MARDHVHREPVRDDVLVSASPPPFAPPSGSGPWIPGRPTSDPPSTRPPTSRLTRATMAGQVAAFLVCAFAAGLLAAWAGAPVVFVGAVVALGGGVAVGSATGVGLRFTNVAGWVAAAAATLATVVVLSLLGAYAQLHLPIAIALLVGLFVVGLGLVLRAAAPRGRRAVGRAGGPVARRRQGVGDRGGAGLVRGSARGVLVPRARRSQRGARARTRGGRPPPRRATSVSDLLGVIGLALAIGFVAAMLIGNPSCSTSPTDPEVPAGAGSSGGSAGQGQGPEPGVRARASGSVERAGPDAVEPGERGVERAGRRLRRRGPALPARP